MTSPERVKTAFCGMKVLVGTRNSPLKLLSLESGKVDREFALPAGVTEVERLIWGPGAAESCAVVAASGRLFVLDLLSGAVHSRGEYSNGPVKLLSLVGEESGDVVVAAESGDVTLFSAAAFPAKPEDGALPAPKLVARTRGPIQAACLGNWGRRGSVVAMGGRERDLTVWSIANARQLWHAKNVPNDKLDLRPPVEHGTCFFMPEDQFMLVSGTGYQELRIYDTRKQGQPIANAKIFPSPVTGSFLNPRDSGFAWFTTSHGEVIRANLSRRMIDGGLRGIAGAQRAVCMHATDPFIATTGVDRFVYVFDSRTRAMKKKIYIKVMGTAMLFLAEEAPKPPKKGRKAAEAVDAESLWESITDANIDDDVRDDGETVERAEDDSDASVADAASEDSGDEAAAERGGRGRGQRGRGKRRTRGGSDRPAKKRRL